MNYLFRYPHAGRGTQRVNLGHLFFFRGAVGRGQRGRTIVGGDIPIQGLRKWRGEEWGERGAGEGTGQQFGEGGRAGPHPDPASRSSLGASGFQASRHLGQRGAGPSAPPGWEGRPFDALGRRLSGGDFWAGAPSTLSTSLLFPRSGFGPPSGLSQP